ncbi:unnamed protein product, partial [Nesidiocoris tenuis]
MFSFRTGLQAPRRPRPGLRVTRTPASSDPHPLPNPHPGPIGRFQKSSLWTLMDLRRQMETRRLANCPQPKPHQSKQ